VIPFGIRANFDSRTSRREQLGLTLRELARRSGVSSSMISDIERGAKSPTLSTLSALVQALGVSMSALLDSASPKSGRIHVVRASERPELVDPISRARRDHFGPTLAGSKVEFLRYAVPPLTLAGPFAPSERDDRTHASRRRQHPGRIRDRCGHACSWRQLHVASPTCRIISTTARAKSRR